MRGRVGSSMVVFSVLASCASDPNEAVAHLPEQREAERVRCGNVSAAGAYASSAQPGHEPALVLDETASTFWHTPWETTNWGPRRALPQSLTLSLGAPRVVASLTYVPPEQVNPNGIITGYRVQVSGDGTSFTTVASGAWAATAAAKTVTFNARRATHVRLVATEGYGGFAAAGDVDLSSCAVGSRCGNGVLESGEQCDGGACCSPTCTFAAAGAQCRAASDACDAIEHCDGTSAVCPADRDLADGASCASGRVCRAGVCTALSWSGPGHPIHVDPSMSRAQLQSIVDGACGNTVVFAPGNYVLGGVDLRGCSDTAFYSAGRADISGGGFDLSGLSDALVVGPEPGGGFTFAGGRVDISDSTRVTVVNNAFHGQASAGFAGAAVHVDGAQHFRVINNDFTNVEGNAVGMYATDNGTIAGNRFVGCRQPISLQYSGSVNRGNNMLVKANVFLQTKRVPLEMGPGGEQQVRNFIVEDNWADDFRNPGTDVTGYSTLLAYSCVASAGDNVVIRNNFARVGTANAGLVGVAAELHGTRGEITGNDFRGFYYGAIVYGSGFDVQRNNIVSASVPVLNYGEGSGTIAGNTDDPSRPIPPQPARMTWP